jgi:hypothetical protein
VVSDVILFSSHFVHFLQMTDDECTFLLDKPNITGEKLKHKELQGYGNKTIIDGKEEAIGAGGRFGGVHLAISDQKTQENNMAMLKAMFEREKKRRRKDQKKREVEMEKEDEQ